MKKQSLFSVAVLSLILLFTLAPVYAQVVNPSWYDFGDVIVGESATTIITLTNNTSPIPIMIDDITLSGNGDFDLVSSSITPPFSLGYYDAIDIEVVFAPSAVGDFSTNLIIMNGQQYSVPLFGTGVATPQPPPTSIVDIISFFDASVANESLVGTGPGASAEGRLNALRNMLFQASYLLSAGNLEGACVQLNDALSRCSDFVQGDAQNDLKQMISGLMNDLGC